jgi:hypothetical protein
MIFSILTDKIKQFMNKKQAAYPIPQVQVVNKKKRKHKKKKIADYEFLNIKGMLSLDSLQERWYANENKEDDEVLEEGYIAYARHVAAKDLD